MLNHNLQNTQKWTHNFVSQVAV